jgi:anthranilate synthase/aminodeoxychorismate synthase-like glutamine amidotransferase
MILLIDNYDSFTYNLVQRLGEIDPQIELEVWRNDKITASEAESKRPTHVIISPGPCTPREAGVSNDIIRTFAGKVPILGVCLGHQCIGAVFGASIVQAPRIMHGKTSMIHHDGRGIFKGLPNPFEATRYHSLIIDPATLPDEFDVTAWTDEPPWPREIMAIRHKRWPIDGVQFHPESFLTGEAGIQMLRNFIGR